MTRPARPREATVFGRLPGQALIAAAITISLFNPARAQLVENIVLPNVPGYNNDPSITVLARPRPEYESLGVRVGEFIIRPNLSEGFGYNDNVLGNPGTGSSPTLMLDTAATLQVNSDWSRNGIGGFASVNDQRYSRQPQQDQTDWTASLGGTYELGRDQLTVAASHLREYEQTTGLDVFNRSTPIPYDLDDVRASYATSFGRITLTPQIEFSAYRFDSVGSADDASNPVFLNRNAIQGGLTTQYELAPRRNLVLSVSGVRQLYVNTAPGQPARNSRGGTALAGFDYAANALFRYYLLAGYQLRQYDSPLYKTHAAPVVNAGVVWVPTGLTTVTVTARRSIEDSTSESLIGYTLTQGGVSVDHEYLRNILLQGSATVAYAEYEQSTVTQTLYTVGASATWLLNRNLLLRLSETFTARRSNAGDNFNGNLVLLRFGAAL